MAKIIDLEGHFIDLFWWLQNNKIWTKVKKPQNSVFSSFFVFFALFFNQFYHYLIVLTRKNIQKVSFFHFFTTFSINKAHQKRQKTAYFGSLDVLEVFSREIDQKMDIFGVFGPFLTLFWVKFMKKPVYTGHFGHFIENEAFWPFLGQFRTYFWGQKWRFWTPFFDDFLSFFVNISGFLTNW